MDARDEIKQRLSVEEVVGDYIQLKRAGRNYKALSPFTNEKTPSFMVSPDKQIWHDFSSAKGGDIFSFVMEMEGVDFVGALEILARRANIDLSQYRNQDKGYAKKKQRVYEANELAIKYYHATLAKNNRALKYLLSERSYTKEIISKFQLGYAPIKGDALVTFLSKKGFSDTEIKDAGLGSSYRGIRDMFRGRIMVPLYDGQGRAVGFTGRILDDGQPKYLNTPQTVVYDKSGHIFGLSKAKTAIREQGFVVIVEGNMDVVAAHMAGTENVVAVAGTAMTKRHLVQLVRLTTDIRLAFDSDQAGLNATMRSIPIAQEVGADLSVLKITGGKDPDDIIKDSPSKWKQLITRSTYVVDWLLEVWQEQYDVTTAKGKKDFSDEASKLLARLTDSVEQEHYTEQIAKILNVSKSSISTKLNKAESQQPKDKKPKVNEEVEVEKYTSGYEDLLIAMLLRYPELREAKDRLEPDYFTADWHKQALKIMDSLPHKPIVKTPKELQEYDTYVKIALFRAEEFYGSWNSNDRMIETYGLTRKLLKSHKNRKKQELTKAIASAEQAKDTAQRKKLIEELNELIKQR